VTGEAATAQEAIDACQLTCPDVALVDLAMPAGEDDRGERQAGDGIAGLLVSARPELAVVGVCDAADERVAAAMRAGARGCVDAGADGAEHAQVRAGVQPHHAHRRAPRRQGLGDPGLRVRP
jgi:DNA-binding NarL/FixJ family response regulator